LIIKYQIKRQIILNNKLKLSKYNNKKSNKLLNKQKNNKF